MSVIESPIKTTRCSSFAGGASLPFGFAVPSKIGKVVIARLQTVGPLLFSGGVKRRRRRGLGYDGNSGRQQ